MKLLSCMHPWEVIAYDMNNIMHVVYTKVLYLRLVTTTKKSMAYLLSEFKKWSFPISQRN